MSGHGQKLAVQVWDFPVRAFHWLLVPLIAFSWWSAEEGRLDWHRLSGYSILALIVFRILWGIFGSETARFGRFLRGPSSVGLYVRSLGARAHAPSVGHNALGGWSVLAMIGLLLAQAVLGLFAVDIDGFESGPLAVFVSFEQGRLAASAHHLTFNAILVLIGLHLLAIFYYAVIERENLVGPMITGRKRLALDAATPKLRPWWLAAIFLAAACALVFSASRAFWSF